LLLYLGPGKKNGIKGGSWRAPSRHRKLENRYADQTSGSSNLGILVRRLQLDRGGKKNGIEGFHDAKTRPRRASGGVVGGSRSNEVFKAYCARYQHDRVQRPEPNSELTRAPKREVEKKIRCAHEYSICSAIIRFLKRSEEGGEGGIGTQPEKKLKGEVNMSNLFNCQNK